VKAWDLTTIETPAGVRSPVVVDSSVARSVLVELRAGEALGEHEVREHAWVVVLTGVVTVEDAVGAESRTTPGTLLAFEPGERRAVTAIETSRLLMFLAPWPAADHDGRPSDSPQAIAKDLGREIVNAATRVTAHVRTGVRSKR
jgi:redox-sensitive bicupin YhaK (pirin superfamily)